MFVKNLSNRQILCPSVGSFSRPVRTAACGGRRPKSPRRTSWRTRPQNRCHPPVPRGPRVRPQWWRGPRVRP